MDLEADNELNPSAVREEERNEHTRNRALLGEDMDEVPANQVVIAQDMNDPINNIMAVAVDMNEPDDYDVALVEDMDAPSDNEVVLVEDMNEPPDNEVLLAEDLNGPANNRDAIDEDEAEEEEFDITLAATHSYLGSSLSEVSGRALLEPGWTGRMPVLAHHGTVFPGETVPMLLNNRQDAAHIAQILTHKEHKIFGLLCPDETNQLVSGYGVVCEVFEAALTPADSAPTSVSFKARAVHRFRLKHMPRRPLPVVVFVRMQPLEVRVLPDVHLAHPLRHVRLASLDVWRRTGGQHQQDSTLRRLDAAPTPWPHFVYEIFDCARMRAIIRDYFHTLGLEKMLPEDVVALSFWVASNLTLPPRDRHALFVVDNVLLRLHMECRFIALKSVLCCTSCHTEIARRDHVFAMSSDGVHSNYTNPSGHMHDLVTVSAARNTRACGAPSAEYSWFPGYAWSVLVCAWCMEHVGWRFDATRRNLRPQQFYGLCRNYVSPRDASEHSPSTP